MAKAEKQITVIQPAVAEVTDVKYTLELTSDEARLVADILYHCVGGSCGYGDEKTPRDMAGDIARSLRTAGVACGMSPKSFKRTDDRHLWVHIS